MPDITMCCCEKCKMKNTCYRATAKANFFYQSYSDFSKFCEKNGYEYYIEDKRKRQALGTM